MGRASVTYKLRAVAIRPNFSQNLQVKVPVFILRCLTSEALEYQQTIDIENTLPEKLMYSIMLPHKAWAAGDTLTAIVKLTPLAKGVYVQAIDSFILETTKIITRGGNLKDTRVVASARREMIIDHKAAHFVSSSSHPPPPQQQEQREEDLEFESNDIVTYINLPIPQSSAYPFLYSASEATSPTTTLSRSSASPPTLQHALLPLSTDPSTSRSSHLTVTPSHNLEPIFISHRMELIMSIHNKDGHVSELGCSLPIRILDGAFLEESRGFTMRVRRLLLRTSGLGGALSWSGEEGGEDEGNEGAGVDGEEGRVRQMEVNRELPSYPAHVRDRVANMFLSDTVTMRVSNPWVGNIGPSGPASGSGASALRISELSGQRAQTILSPLIIPSDPVPATLHIQPDSQASCSGDTTPDIQSSQQRAQAMPNLLVDEAARQIGGLPSSIGGQQQSQPHHHQHQTHDQEYQQHSRTLRSGNRVGSRVGSTASSPERCTALSPVTATNDSENNPSSISEGGSPNSVVSSSSIQSPGFASPFQNLFKATMKSFTALAGHHGHGHSHRPTHSLSRSTSLTELGSSSPTGMATAGATTNSSQPSEATELMRSELVLSLTCSSLDAGQIFSSAPSPSPQNEMMNGFISDSPSSPSQVAENGMTAPSLSSPSDSSGLESTSESSHTASASVSPSPLSYTVTRAFSQVPDYGVASRGFIGGIPPLSSMRGLPSYEEAEAQRKEREAAEMQSLMQTQLPIQNQGQTAIQTQMQTQPQNQVVDKTKDEDDERGSMSVADLAGHIGVQFESGTRQAVAETEARIISHSMSGASGYVGIMQRLDDGDVEDENENDMGAGAMRIKKLSP